MNSTWIAVTLMFLAVMAGASESVQLRSGSVLVGSVDLRDSGQTLVIRTVFPKKDVVEVSSQEVTPASLYWVHQRRTEPDDIEGRLRLAAMATEAEMYGIAISEYLFVQELDPDRQAMVDGRVKALSEMLAADILESAEDLLEVGDANSALVYLHTISELYPRTKAAKRASELMGEVHQLAGAAAWIAKETVDPREVPRLLEKMEKYISKGDAALATVGGHVGSTVSASSQRRALDRAIRYYDKAWQAGRSIPATLPEGGRKVKAGDLHDQAHSKLVKAYLNAASLQLQRGSITKAEEYCTMACELDPENELSHHIHRLILEAKAYGL